LQCACERKLESFSTVTLGNSLDFVLLLDGKRVGSWTWSLGGSEDFIGKDFAHGLNGSERGLSGTLSDQVDSLVHSSEGWNVDCLSSDDTTGTDSGWVFSGTTIADGVDDNLKWVLTSGESKNFEGLSHDSDCQLLLATVSTLAHQSIHKTFDKWAVHFLETSLLVSAGGEGQENLGLICFSVQVGQQRDVLALYTFVWPSAEELNLWGVWKSLFFNSNVSV
jgi:hypothetical protein